MSLMLRMDVRLDVVSPQRTFLAEMKIDGAFSRESSLAHVIDRSFKTNVFHAAILIECG